MADAVEAMKTPETAPLHFMVTAIGLFASALKSGEQWTEACDKAFEDAGRALGALERQIAEQQPQPTLVDAESVPLVPITLPHTMEKFMVPEPVREWARGLVDTISSAWDVLDPSGHSMMLSLEGAIKARIEQLLHPKLDELSNGIVDARAELARLEQLGKPYTILPLDGALALLGIWAKNVAHDRAYRGMPETRQAEDGTEWLAIYYSDRIELTSTPSAFASESDRQDVARLEREVGGILRAMAHCDRNTAGNKRTLTALEGHSDPLSKRNRDRILKTMDKNTKRKDELEKSIEPFEAQLKVLRARINQLTPMLQVFDHNLSRLYVGVLE